MKDWHDEMYTFLRLCNDQNVRMLMVGGGAVNFHGYQRHSNDLDFWLDTSVENFDKLLKVFKEMGYVINDIPEEVRKARQNISIKFPPLDLHLELITNFSINKSFDEAYKQAEIVSGTKGEKAKWHVISLDDLITSKIKSGRPKDLLDVHELQKRKSDLE